MSLWTEPAVALLTQKYSDGYSDGMIAMALADELHLKISRNAVIGKRTRLGLVRANPISNFTANGVKCGRNIKPRQKSTRTLKQLFKEHLPAGRFEAPPPPTTEFQCLFPALTNKSCRFPCWDAKAAIDQKFYCGVPEADLYENRPYCRYHTGLASAGKPEPKVRSVYRGRAA